MLRCAAVLAFVVLFIPDLKAQCSQASEFVSVPNRPTVTTASATTQCGVVEADYGLTLAVFPRSTRQNVLGGSLRFGVTDKFDLRWGNDSLSHVSAREGDRTGAGDNYVGLRYRFREASHSLPSLAVGYNVKVPSASPSKGLGSGYFDHALVLMASQDWGKFHADFNASALGLGGAPSRDYAALWSGSVSHPITTRLSGAVEVYSYTFLDATQSGTASGLSALTYQVSHRLVLDCALDVGMTPGTPRKRLLAGLTYAIGRTGRRR